MNILAPATQAGSRQHKLASGYLYGIIDLMIFAFACDAIVDLRSPRLRFVVFDVSKWLLYALPRLILPVPVRLKRFFEALCDFILGIASVLRF
jgi:hypothetical protein